MIVVASLVMDLEEKKERVSLCVLSFRSLCFVPCFLQDGRGKSFWSGREKAGRQAMKEGREGRQERSG